MTLVQAQIALGLSVLLCGQVIVWWRRDNVLGYVQAGLFFATFALPLLSASMLQRFEVGTLRLLATLVWVGSLAYLAGIFAGAPLGERPVRRLSFTFEQPLDRGAMLERVTLRTRMLGAAGLAILAAGYALIGYIPLLATDRTAAKYGVGPYAEGFAEGAIPYRLGLAITSLVLPVVLGVAWKRKSPIDWLLAGGIVVGLGLSLNRTLAFLGALLFLVAVACEKRVRPVLIAGGVTLLFLSGALVNELLLGGGASRGSLPERVAASAPDVPDALGFLEGLQRSGERWNGTELLSGLAVGGDTDPAIFALRTATNIDDVSDFPSGGLRLPAPVWGYAAYGLPGAAAWSFLSGLFVGWGTVRVKRLLTPILQERDTALNLILGAVLYTGTFGLLATFYFATTVMFVHAALALFLGLAAVPGRRTLI